MIGLGLLLLPTPFSLAAIERGLLVESSTILGLLDESFELNIMPTVCMCQRGYGREGDVVRCFEPVPRLDEVLRLFLAARRRMCVLLLSETLLA